MTARAASAGARAPRRSVKGKAVRDADLTEKMAFFEAYGSLCGDGGVAHLDAIAQRQGAFSAGARTPRSRACAAIALGRIGTDKRVDALRKAAGEKDVVVRNAVDARAAR